MRLGMLAAGAVKSARDLSNVETSENRKFEFEKMRRDADDSREQRIHERNRGEKIADRDEERKYKKENTSIDADAPASIQTMEYVAKNVFGGDKKKAAAWYKQAKNKSPTEMASALYLKAKSDSANFGKSPDEIQAIVRETMAFAADFGVGDAKKPQRKADAMSYDEAKQKADALYDERASTWKSDTDQFNMSEQDIKDLWTSEFQKDGKPSTGIKNAGGGMLRVDSLDKKLDDKPNEKTAGWKSLPANVPEQYKTDGTYEDGKGGKIEVKNGRYREI